MAASASMRLGSPMAGQDLAPIALFVYKRPLHTLQTLYTLSRCPEAAHSDLYVFADGPRTPAEQAAVDHTREVVRSQAWCKRVELVESPRNRGLARSIIDGVTRLCAEHGRAIVLEDDLLVARGLLGYMNAALERYASRDEVMLVSGHSFPAFPPEPRAVVLPVATTWGWATWQRAWQRFEESPSGTERLSTDAAFGAGFDLAGAIRYREMLAAQRAGRIDSWGIRWWWSVYKHSGRGIFPLQSLVRHAGAGDDATHVKTDTRLHRETHWRLDNEIDALPEDTAVDEAAFGAWKRYLRNSTSLGQRLYDRALERLARVRLWRS